MNETPSDEVLSPDNLLSTSDENSTDLISELFTDSILPVPAKRNLAKAAARLCSAAIDVPITYLEGKTAELRAISEERVKLVKTTSKQISKQMKVDPEYARRAVTQFGNKVLREQINLDMTVARAIDELNEKNKLALQDSNNSEIDEDWLENFDAEARKKNTTEMQSYFAKILAGEIIAPNSFSIKSLRILGNMDKQVARLFQKFCSNCILLSEFGGKPIDARMISISGNWASNSLSKYGFTFGKLNILNEYGLVISDYNSWIDSSFVLRIDPPNKQSVGQQSIVMIPFGFQGGHWMLQPESMTNTAKPIRLNGVALTQSGIELLRVINLEKDDKYLNDLCGYFKQRKFEMIRAESATPIVV